MKSPVFRIQETFRTVIWLRLICGSWHLSLSKFFRRFYYRWKRRTVVFVGKFSRGNVVASMTKLSFCYTQALQCFPRKLPEIRIPTWYGRIISKKAKIRIGYGQSVPCGMSAVTHLIKSHFVTWRVTLTHPKSVWKISLIMHQCW